jgi:transcriptional regulator with XRE-family HTH domain
MKLNIDRIKKRMEYLGWTNTELARRIGCSRQCLSYYLNSEIRGMKKIEKLAAPLGIKPKDLLI